MVAARKSTGTHTSGKVPVPPIQQLEPIIHASHTIQDWLTFYWQKLGLPVNELSRQAVTQGRGGTASGGTGLLLLPSRASRLNSRS